MDVASELLIDAKIMQEKSIARLTGELLVDQRKHWCVIGNKHVLSPLVRPLVFLGRVDLDSLLMALEKMGLKVTAQHAQSTDGTENVSIICISEPNEALIEVTSTQTTINVGDETTASLVSEAFIPL